MAYTSLNILYLAQKRNDGEIKGLTVRVEEMNKSLGELKEQLREIKGQMSSMFKFMKEEEKPRTINASHVFDEMFSSEFMTKTSKLTHNAPKINPNYQSRAHKKEALNLPIKKVNKAEYEERKAQRLCFHCNEKHTWRHLCNPRLFNLVITSDEIEVEDVSEVVEKKAVTNRVEVFTGIQNNDVDGVIKRLPILGHFSCSKSVSILETTFQHSTNNGKKEVKVNSAIGVSSDQFVLPREMRNLENDTSNFTMEVMRPSMIFLTKELSAKTCLLLVMELGTVKKETHLLIANEGGYILRSALWTRLFWESRQCNNLQNIADSAVKHGEAKHRLVIGTITPEELDTAFWWLIVLESYTKLYLDVKSDGEKLSNHYALVSSTITRGKWLFYFDNTYIPTQVAQEYSRLMVEKLAKYQRVNIMFHGETFVLFDPGGFFFRHTYVRNFIQATVAYFRMFMESKEQRSILITKIGSFILIPKDVGYIVKLEFLHIKDELIDASLTSLGNKCKKVVMVFDPGWGHLYCPVQKIGDDMNELKSYCKYCYVCLYPWIDCQTYVSYEQLLEGVAWELTRSTRGIVFFIWIIFLLLDSMISATLFIHFQNVQPHVVHKQSCHTTLLTLFSIWIWDPGGANGLNII